MAAVKAAWVCGKAEEDTADRKGHSGSSLLCHMISSSVGLLNDRLANQLGQQKAKAPQASWGGGEHRSQLKGSMLSKCALPDNIKDTRMNSLSLY